MVQVTMDLKIHMYVAISFERQPQKTHKKKEEYYTVADSGCTGNFLAVYSHLDNV